MWLRFEALKSALRLKVALKVNMRELLGNSAGLAAAVAAGREAAGGRYALREARPTRKPWWETMDMEGGGGGGGYSGPASRADSGGGGGHGETRAVRAARRAGVRASVEPHTGALLHALSGGSGGGAAAANWLCCCMARATWRCGCSVCQCTLLAWLGSC